MQKKQLNIFIAEDHPFVIDHYKMILETNPEYDFSFVEASNFSESFRKINLSIQKKTIDLFLIDIQMPASNDGKITTGEELTIYANKKFPASKILILTAVSAADRLKTILKYTPHDGVLLKTDITPDSLNAAFYCVLNDGKYYSEKVKLIRTRSLNDEDILDEIDENIIYYLSKGVKTKELVKYLALKLSAIEKRKRKIKLIFNIENGGDQEILKEAEQRGYI